MAIAITLQEYLSALDIDYDLLAHNHTDFSMETAAVAHVPGAKLAKSVILKDGPLYLMAVIPSTHHIKLTDLNRKLKRNLKLVSEEELASLFVDCELGAIPPIGQAYDMDVIIDDKVFDQKDVYFEAGDHENLIHMSDKGFERITGGSRHEEFTCRI